jgi:hypothetical protein
MTRRGMVLRMLMIGLLAGAPASAQGDIGDQIAAELRAEGYTDVTVERTLLGRVRIVGRMPGRRREVVVDRGTGEILRDLTEEEGSALPRRPSPRAHA